MEIKSLAGTGFDKVFEAFSRAFADYEMQLDSVGLRAMLRRRGYTPELSFAAFDGGEIVAFTLNGTGNFKGIPTAYDTGTGTLEQYRGQGLATRIFEYSLPFLRETGIRQYLLEVLRHNTKAVSVYSKLGFEVAREFHYSRQEQDRVRTGGANTDCHIKKIKVEEFPYAVSFTDFEPSWQNSLESVRRAGDLVSIGAFEADILRGYCIVEPASGDIAQLAVAPAARRRGIGSLLLEEAMALNRNSAIKVINTDISCTPVTAFLESKNIPPSGKQYEMIKQL